MDNFAVTFQGLISVAARVEPAAGEVARDRPPRDATSAPYVPNLSPHLPGHEINAILIDN